MQFQQGARVFTADEQDVGTVDRVVIDPRDQEVSHIVVRKGRFLPEDKVVPIHLIASTSDDHIVLAAKPDRIDDLPPFKENHYISFQPPKIRNYDNQGLFAPLYCYPPLP